jgi:hypothetical protein
VGAIFAIPVAAVISAFFFHYLNRSQGGPRDVTSRAARRLEARQGRPVRVPAPPPVTAPGSMPLAGAAAPASASVPTAAAQPTPAGETPSAEATQ